MRIHKLAFGSMMALVAAALLAWADEPGPDGDVGLVQGSEHPVYNPANPTDFSKYGDPEDGPLISGCYDVEISCLSSLTSEGAAIVVHAYHENPQYNTTMEIDPGAPPEELHCNWQYVEIEYHPDGPLAGQAGWGVMWTPAGS